MINFIKNIFQKTQKKVDEKKVDEITHICQEMEIRKLRKDKKELQEKMSLIENALQRCERDYRALSEEKALQNFQFHDVKERALKTADHIKEILK